MQIIFDGVPIWRTLVKNAVVARVVYVVERVWQIR